MTFWKDGGILFNWIAISTFVLIQGHWSKFLITILLRKHVQEPQLEKLLLVRKSFETAASMQIVLMA
jgi:hypothetical protein